MQAGSENISPSLSQLQLQFHHGEDSTRGSCHDNGDRGVACLAVGSRQTARSVSTSAVTLSSLPHTTVSEERTPDPSLKTRHIAIYNIDNVVADDILELAPMFGSVTSVVDTRPAMISIVYAHLWTANLAFQSLFDYVSCIDKSYIGRESALPWLSFVVDYTVTTTAILLKTNMICQLINSGILLRFLSQYGDLMGYEKLASKERDVFYILGVFGSTSLQNTPLKYGVYDVYGYSVEVRPYFAPPASPSKSSSPSLRAASYTASALNRPSHMRNVSTVSSVSTVGCGPITSPKTGHSNVTAPTSASATTSTTSTTTSTQPAPVSPLKPKVPSYASVASGGRNSHSQSQASPLRRTSVASVNSRDQPPSHTRNPSEASGSSGMPMANCSRWGDPKLGVVTRSASDSANSINVRQISAGLDSRTTIMLRNIPNKIDQVALKKYIDVTNKNTYDFLYLRIDFVNKCNVGYAFINFTDPRHIVTLAYARAGTKWNEFNSDKICDLCYANMQVFSYFRMLFFANYKPIC